MSVFPHSFFFVALGLPSLLVFDRFVLFFVVCFSLLFRFIVCTCSLCVIVLRFCSGFICAVSTLLFFYLLVSFAFFCVGCLSFDLFGLFLFGCLSLSCFVLFHRLHLFVVLLSFGYFALCLFVCLSISCFFVLFLIVCLICCLLVLRYRATCLCCCLYFHLLALFLCVR